MYADIQQPIIGLRLDGSKIGAPNMFIPSNIAYIDKEVVDLKFCMQQ